MNKRKLRDILRLTKSIIFSWLYFPHFLTYLMSNHGGGGDKKLIKSDLAAIEKQLSIRIPIILQLFYQLHNNRYYRSIFYHRVGPVISALIGWYRPGDRYFKIANKTKFGRGICIAHPYATIINADSIGDNFHCIHCTTIGATDRGVPVLGNNVSLGANVTIIGPVHIGNNVVIGAGAVVVKDLPDNCVAVGNPAVVIRYIK